MSGTFWTRISLILAVLAWGAWILFPTVFLEPDAQEKLAGQVADIEGGDKAEAAEEAPWWGFMLADARLNLGLDLQGGLDLSLEVDVDEAAISVVQRDVGPFREAAKKEALSLSEVRRASGEPVLIVRPEEGVGLSDLTAFVEKRFNRYQYDSTRTVDGQTWFAYRLAEAEAQSVRESAVEQALETLRNRIDETGVKEPTIVRQGGNRISVQIPGMSDPNQAVKAVGTTALLEFKMVDEEASKNEASIQKMLLDASKSLTATEFNDDDALNEWLWTNGHVARDRRLMFEYVRGQDGKLHRSDIPGQIYIVNDEVQLTGDDINKATTSQDQYGSFLVALDFKPPGARKFGQLTEANVGRRFAIILDNAVRSAPVIKQAILGGSCTISMGTGTPQDQYEEASTLALVLRTGSLPAPVNVTGVRVIGPGLGADAIAAGKLGTLIGFVLVVSYMLVYYRASGVVAVIALVTNVFLGFALMTTAGATLTLPGITGIALTVGMAVDCNIVIFERIKEELRLGRNGRAATDTGFDKALWAVLDSNITTMIAGIVLYTYGTGPIRGFAVTLMIGIITTLFSGIFVSRTLMDFLTRKASARLSI